MYYVIWKRVNRLRIHKWKRRSSEKEKIDELNDMIVYTTCYTTTVHNRVYITTTLSHSFFYQLYTHYCDSLRTCNIRTENREQISSFTYLTPFSLFDHDLLSGPPSFLTKYVFLSCCILNTSNHSTQMDVISRS